MHVPKITSHKFSSPFGAIEKSLGKTKSFVDIMYEDGK
jgi:hypothetical protein